MRPDIDKLLRGNTDPQRLLIAMDMLEEAGDSKEMRETLLLRYHLWSLYTEVIGFEISNERTYRFPGSVLIVATGCRRTVRVRYRLYHRPMLINDVLLNKRIAGQNKFYLRDKAVCEVYWIEYQKKYSVTDRAHDASEVLASLLRTPINADGV